MRNFLLDNSIVTVTTLEKIGWILQTKNRNKFMNNIKNIVAKMNLIWFVKEKIDKFVFVVAKTIHQMATNACLIFLNWSILFYFSKWDFSDPWQPRKKASWIFEKEMLLHYLGREQNATQHWIFNLNPSFSWSSWSRSWSDWSILRVFQFWAKPRTEQNNRRLSFSSTIKQFTLKARERSLHLLSGFSDENLPSLTHTQSSSQTGWLRKPLCPPPPLPSLG